MATTSKAPKAPKVTFQHAFVEGEIKEIHLGDIVSNTSQSRGMGVLTRLGDMGYGLFEKTTADKDALWDLLLSDDDEKRKLGVSLIQDFEDPIARFWNEDISKNGLLQPVGVVALDDGFDAVWGMRRLLAKAFGYALNVKNGNKIEARVIEGKHSPHALKLIAHRENDDREDESPIDKAMFYQELHKKGKMSPQAIGDLIGKTDQYVRSYIKLLDPLLKDKLKDIHTRKLSVDGALKLLVRLKEGGNGNGRETKDGERFRFPPIKKVEAWSQAKVKPESFVWDDEVWEAFHEPAVQTILSAWLGVVFNGKPAEEPAEEEKADKKRKVIKVPRAKAVKMFEALGKKTASTWDDAELIANCEDVVSDSEEDHVFADAKLGELFSKLYQGYKEGIEVILK